MRPHVVADVGNSRVKWGLCSPDGARILATLAWELRRRGGGYGLAAICIGVGQAVAVVVQA